MTIAILAWLVGLLPLLWFLRFNVRRGHVTATAVLLILVPQVFIRPVLFFGGLDEPYPYEYFAGPDWNLVATGLLLALAWVLVFSSAHILMLRPLTPFGKLLPQEPKHFNIRVLTIAALATTLLGVVLTCLLILDAGSLARFIFQVKVGKELAGAYVVREISVIGAIFSILAILYHEKRHRSALRHRRDRRMVWLASGLFIVNLAFNYSWGNRYNIAMLTFAIGISWHLHIQRISVRKLLFLVLITAVLLQGLKMFRNTAVEEALGREILRDHTFWTDISTSLHFNQFDAFMLALRDAGDRFAFREGKDFVNGLLAWVPREFYPEKETFHVGQWFRQVYEPAVVNGWPITTMGSWYVNFGFIGILFGGIVSGIVAAWFDAGFRNVRGSFWQAAVAPAVALLMFDGGVGPGFVQDIFLVIVPIYLLVLMLRITSTRQNATREQLSRYSSFAKFGH